MYNFRVHGQEWRSQLLKKEESMTDDVKTYLRERGKAVYDFLQEEDMHDHAATVSLLIGLALDGMKNLNASGGEWTPFLVDDPRGPEELQHPSILTLVDTIQQDGLLRREMSPEAVIWRDVANPIVGWRYSGRSK